MKKITLFITLILTASYNVYSAYPNPGAGFFGAPLNLNPQIPVDNRPSVNLTTMRDLLLNIKNGTMKYAHSGGPRWRTELKALCQQIAQLANAVGNDIISDATLSLFNKRKETLQQLDRLNPGSTLQCSLHGLNLDFDCPQCQFINEGVLPSQYFY